MSEGFNADTMQAASGNRLRPPSRPHHTRIHSAAPQFYPRFPRLLCLAFLAVLNAAAPPARANLSRAQRRHDAPALRPLHCLRHMAGLARTSSRRAELLPAFVRASNTRTSSTPALSTALS